MLQHSGGTKQRENVEGKQIQNAIMGEIVGEVFESCCTEVEYFRKVRSVGDELTELILWSQRGSEEKRGELFGDKVIIG